MNFIIQESVLVMMVEKSGKKKNIKREKISIFFGILFVIGLIIVCIILVLSMFSYYNKILIDISFITIGFPFIYFGIILMAQSENEMSIERFDPYAFPLYGFLALLLAIIFSYYFLVYYKLLSIWFILFIISLYILGIGCIINSYKEFKLTKKLKVDHDG